MVVYIYCNIIDDKVRNSKRIKENIYKEIAFFFNFQFYTIKSRLQDNNILYKTTTILNMTITQRKYFLDKVHADYGKEISTTFGPIYLRMFNTVEMILKEFQNNAANTYSNKCKIPDGFFYFFMKCIKFCIKYNLFELISPWSNIQIRSIQLLNEIIIVNLWKNQEEIKDSRSYIQLIHLEEIFAMIILTLIYYNDSITLKILDNTSLSAQDEYSFTYNHKNLLIVETTKLFGNALLIRNLAKDLEKELSSKAISVSYLFYDLKFNYEKNSHCNYLIYDSLVINNRIKGIFGLLVQSFFKGIY